MDIYAYSNIQVCMSTMQHFKIGTALEHRGIMFGSLHVYKIAQNSFHVWKCWCQYQVT